MPENNPDTELYWLIGIVAVFFLILLLFGLVSFINDFSQELRYLNNEIRRTDGAERRHYIRQRRRLWLSLIPFVKYWSTYNRSFSVVSVVTKMCLVFEHFTSPSHRSPMGGNQRIQTQRCVFWLPKGNEGELKVWIIRWRKYGISYPQHSWCWWYSVPCFLWVHGY